ncbi:hypothetical protein A0128_08155 [Leptospira tipperaryensis]|uniref:Beta-propeller repeat protein n=1 Tax=Leptospira tipperaryensis TaxID=2564040 RepID=A0A1D7UW49_9LEPT|nr:SBBP repeat-containing protein [Leptospira tipperaryensis]AOP33816.1 hypothetical protein A0128_08155 [Leptospira tipperaryensis]
MNFRPTIFKNVLLILILTGTFLTCKHDKKEMDDLTLFSLVQLFSGITTPGPKAEWTRLLGQNSGLLKANSISSDQNNNVYVTGQASGNLDGQPLTGIYDLFVTKYNSSGSKQWTRLMGVAGDQTNASAIASDSSGSVYSVGTTNGALDGEVFDGSPDFADRDLFIVKFDSNGNKLWTRLLGIAAGGKAGATSAVTDSTGNIFVTGTSTSGLDGQTFGGGGNGYFIVKYNSTGTKQWTKLYAGPSPSAIAYDSTNGRIYLTFSTPGTPLNGVSATDFLLIQFDNNGNKLWTKQTGVPGKDTVSNALTLDNFGNIYITGSTNGNIDDQVESAQNATDLLIVKFDINGNRIWTRQLGFTIIGFDLSGKTAEGKGIVFDKNQNIYVTGYTTGNLDKQTHSDARNAKHNIFTTKFDLNGNKIWTSITGLKGFNCEASSITGDQLGHSYLTGFTESSLNGETFLGKPGFDYNLFIIKY